LESIKKNGSEVKRVVITSSMVAIGGLTDSQWNEAALERVKTKGAEATGRDKYSASKVLAERAAWDFVEEHKAEIGFDLVTVCPPMIYGPGIQDGGVNFTNQFLLDALLPVNRKTGAALSEQVGSYSDVRDIAAIHVDVLVTPKAGGQRFIATASPYAWNDIYAVLGIPFALPPGPTPALAVPDNTKLSTILGKPLTEIFRPIAVTLHDAVEDARKRGWKGEYN